MDLALWGKSYFIGHILITCLPQEMANVADGHLSHPPRSSVLTREEVVDGFQIAGFLSPGLRHLHLEEACFLVKSRAENISSDSPSPWEIQPYWETFYDHYFLLSQIAGRLIPDQVKAFCLYVPPGVNFQIGPIGR